MKKTTVRKIFATAMLTLVLSLFSVSYIQAAAPIKNQAVIFPSRLIISSIQVDAKIDPMGITKQGTMESPSGAKNVGWFALGVNPGDSGSAVIAGHYGRWKNGNVSVFDYLHTLKPGDKIYVKNNQGVIITFVVRKLSIYDKNADAPEVFTSNDDASHLNIIACYGIYEEALKTYSQRLVVFTDKQ